MLFCGCGCGPFGGFVVLFVLDVVTCSGFVASVLLCLVLNLKLISLFPLLLIACKAFLSLILFRVLFALFLFG